MVKESALKEGCLCLHVKRQIIGYRWQCGIYVDFEDILPKLCVYISGRCEKVVTDKATPKAASLASSGILQGTESDPPSRLLATAHDPWPRAEPG